MPPKKKPRLPSRGPSTPSATSVPDTPQNQTQAQTQTQPTKSALSSQPPEPSKQALALDENHLLNDPWTEEQETALFKGIVKWKPVGMHKHFRMIGLYDYIHSSGVASRQDQHTRIPGIWEKLNSLYNLPILDERENAFVPSPPEDSETLYHPFSLPASEFGEEMWARRIALSPSTPAASDKQTETPYSRSRLASTIEDTDEPRSSPVAGGGGGGRRTGRSGTGKRGKATKVHVEIEARALAVTGQEVEDAVEGSEEDEVLPDVDADAGDGDEDEGDEREDEGTENHEENSEEAEEEAKAPLKKSKSARNKGGGRVASRRRAKGK